MLKALGFSRVWDIDAANLYVCGVTTLEGVAHPKVSICRCSIALIPAAGSASARSGVGRPHDRMIWRCSPSSPARSPRPSTCPMRHRSKNVARPICCPGKLGLKANALYRDGSKLSQPLATTAFNFEDDMDDDNQEAARPTQTTVQTVVTERIVERVVEKGSACGSAKTPTPPQELYPESHCRRPQGLSAHRRI